MALMANTLNGKIRGNVVCHICKIDTTQVLHEIGNKKMWVCKECGAEVKKGAKG
jgi:ribosomal protein L37AE/L43A